MSPIEQLNEWNEQHDLHIVHTASSDLRYFKYLATMNGINSLRVNYTGFYSTQNFFMHFGFINMAWNGKVCYELRSHKQILKKCGEKNPQKFGGWQDLRR